MTATAPKIVGASQTREPVYVFGSDLRGDFTQHTAVNAVRLHRADPATLSGGSGNAYAIPYRDAAGAPLGYGALAAHVGAFLRQARACPQDVFHIARFACEADAHDDATMARQFAQAPANCKLPGVWLRELDPHTPMRLLIFDPFARFKDRVWQDKLRRYLALNVSTRSGAVIELVSVGSAQPVRWSQTTWRPRDSDSTIGCLVRTRPTTGVRLRSPPKRRRCGTPHIS